MDRLRLWLFVIDQQLDNYMDGSFRDKGDDVAIDVVAFFLVLIGVVISSSLSTLFVFRCTPKKMPKFRAKKY